MTDLSKSIFFPSHLLAGYDQAPELKAIGVHHSGIRLIPLPRLEAYLDETFFLTGATVFDMFLALFQERNTWGVFFKD